MSRWFNVGVVSIAAVVICSGQTQKAGTQTGTGQATAASQRAVVDKYCVGCHNGKLKTGGLALDGLDMAHVAANPEPWEKGVRKLRAGVMPPPGLPRPSGPGIEPLASALENDLDHAAAGRPNLTAPGIH